ncbi:MAG: hypothetical protein HC901_01060, partial [Bdellovibrionaceae bacterium]|nr:hypothetical protein [Pseudobdellovibrionaceae bacterium]
LINPAFHLAYQSIQYGCAALLRHAGRHLEAGSDLRAVQKALVSNHFPDVLTPDEATMLDAFREPATYPTPDPIKQPPPDAADALAIALTHARRLHAA